MEINSKDDLMEFLSTIEERVTSVEQAQKSMYDEQQNSNNDNPQEDDPQDKDNNDNPQEDDPQDKDNNDDKEQDLDELEKLLGF